MKVNPQKQYSLDDSLQYIKGVGPKRALLLEKLGLACIEDCLFFLPFRYEDRTLVKKIADLTLGERVTFTGEIVAAETQRIGRRRKILEMHIQDETGTTSAKWFRFREPYMAEKFPIGSQVILSGKPEINRYLGSGLEIIHPDMEVISVKENETPEIGKLIPVYHSTEGLHVKTLRTILKRVVETHAFLVNEILPDEIIRRHKFPSRSEALHQVHLPANDISAKDLDHFRTPAQRRLIFEEFFLIQLGLAFKR
ncbi:MAG: DNA helicase RecG, partial [Nitrospinae bacterium]|nr:DNA helicase RecG [Nitrospinota bacterium]